MLRLPAGASRWVARAFVARSLMLCIVIDRLPADDFSCSMTLGQQQTTRWLHMAACALLIIMDRLFEHILACVSTASPSPPPPPKVYWAPRQYSTLPFLTPISTTTNVSICRSWETNGIHYGGYVANGKCVRAGLFIFGISQQAAVMP